MEQNDSDAPKMTQKRFGCLQVIGLMAIAVLLTAGAAFFIVKVYFFPSEFKPVSLKPAEEKVLAAKLENLDPMTDRKTAHQDGVRDWSSKSDRFDPDDEIEPEAYSEQGAKREIGLTERELNGLLAKETDLAKKVAFDLSDDLISAKLLLPVDEDFPILGGKILRLKSGMVLSYTNGKPVVILKGVTIMGVPVPNAWLGGIKNIDLVEKFGTDEGFWKTFSAGVENIKVEEGLLKITLKE